MITLLAPEENYRYTGGYLYNHSISAAAAGDRFRYCRIPEPLPRVENLSGHGIPDHSRLLLDSLFFRQAEWALRVIRRRTAPVSLLIHFLPSLDPTLPPEMARRMEEKEASCILSSRSLITTSTYMQRKIRELHGKSIRIGVVRPGLSAGPGEGRIRIRNLKRQTGSLVLLTVSNWTPAKNHRFLLNVLKAVENRPWRWKIFGAGSGDGRLEEVFLHNARQLGLQDRIYLGPGLTPVQIRQEMQDADVFLLPSIFESYGMAAAEALCEGLPLIANRTGGLPEVLGNSKAGALCTTGNTGEWVRALNNILSSAARRERMHKAALSRAHTLPGWTETAEKLCRFLEDQ